ncbi:hypothetical protein PFAG_00412 [Plasmodium falciparum Santa Lucia]|uniref:Uncharacterized protein n=1 Tax=Plasmodium falciparum Santa Lucia TaxID=478859 RepID=W7GC37_PLAFA|nr:hypothetical protein PFAG_00412 [Plasmodium falciparum Santa Lucia]
MDGDISRKSYVEILKYYSKDENKLGGHNFGKNKKKDLNKYDIYYKDYLYDYYKELVVIIINSIQNIQIV